MKINNVLISVSDKKGIVEFANGLAKLKIGIISTGGTAKVLKDAKIKTKSIERLTAFPEILGGRVKSLHPAVHGGILAKRDDEQHIKELKRHKIKPIDMVVCNLYPFGKVVSKQRKFTTEEAVENIDIGGPTLIRAAAKNYKHVAVVVNPDQYSDVIKELGKNNRSFTEETTLRLASEAFNYVSQYDILISTFFSEIEGKRKFPEFLNLRFEKLYDLRYGENPADEAAFYKEKDAGFPLLKKYQGKELSFNNFLDLHSAARIAYGFDSPACAIIKHTNPCGVGVGKSLVDAYKRAHICDPVSAFGSVVGFNRICDSPTAQEIASTFVECVIAPSYKSDALEIFKKKRNLRVTELGRLDEDYDIRKLPGGLLLQYPSFRADSSEWESVTERAPNKNELKALLFAWKVVHSVKSNAIVLATEERTIGIGAGQMSRIDAVELAIKKALGAGSYTRGTVLASDAFFPFRDSIDKTDEAGVTAVVQPGGSVRDKEVIDAANEHNIAMMFTGERCFRH